jgi:hypothetical protein
LRKKEKEKMKQKTGKRNKKKRKNKQKTEKEGKGLKWAGPYTRLGVRGMPYRRTWSVYMICRGL